MKKINRRRFFKNALGAGSLSFFPLHTFFSKTSKDSRGMSLSSSGRKRIRALGIQIGEMETGAFNAITDVKGIRVGQTTIIKGTGKGATRTGVTAILPNDGKIYEENLFGAHFSLNGWGEMTGIAPLEQSGRLSTPIFLTGTYNVGIVYDAAVKHQILQSANGKHQVHPPVVAECFDDFLSDTQKRMIGEKDVFSAIENARTGPVEEGAVGGGTGMVSFEFKGGIGTSSRIVPMDDQTHTVGVLVMTNTAERTQLRIDGVPVGREIKGFEIQTERSKSIILIAATDAPLLPFQLKKLAKRVALGLAKTGATSNTGSGDIIFAFSTGNKIPSRTSQSFLRVKSVNDFFITPIYKGVIDATQEAILNALSMAETVTGRDGNTAFGLPLDQVQAIMKKYHGIKDKPGN